MKAIDAAGTALAEALGDREVVDLPLYGLTAAGEHALIWHALALRRGLAGEPRAALRASIGLLLQSAVVDGALKAAIGRTRPAPRRHRYPFRQPVSTSFPSGHASASAFALVVLGEDDPWIALYLPLAVAVAWSRVHVGVHHLSDVLGGAAIGAALGLLVRQIAPLHPSRPAKDPLGRPELDGAGRN